MFEQEEKDYYKQVRLGNFWSNSYIKYKDNVDKNKTQSIREYLDEFKPYLKDTANNL